MKYPVVFLDFETEQEWRDYVVSQCPANGSLHDLPHHPATGLDGPILVIRDEAGVGIKGIGWRKK